MAHAPKIMRCFSAAMKIITEIIEAFLQILMRWANAFRWHAVARPFDWAFRKKLQTCIREDGNHIWPSYRHGAWGLFFLGSPCRVGRNDGFWRLCLQRNALPATGRHRCGPEANVASKYSTESTAGGGIVRLRYYIPSCNLSIDRRGCTSNWSE